MWHRGDSISDVVRIPGWYMFITGALVNWLWGLSANGPKTYYKGFPELYVAFTRATRSLLVTCYKENSISCHLTKFANMDLQELQSEQS